MNRFVREVLGRFDTLYRGPGGVFVTAVTENGEGLDPRPILPDFGDILPFLWSCGRPDLAEEQLRLAQCLLHHGLVANDGRITALDNHDFLLGLVELAALSGASSPCGRAAGAAKELHRVLCRDGAMVCEAPADASARGPLLPRTSPFNAGYIELFVDLHGLTHEPWFLDQAQREAEVWITNPFFRRRGLFRRVEFAGRPWLTSAARFLSRGPLVCLFKDNTNLVYALLALQAVAPSDRLETTVLNWMKGFEAHFLGDGGVPLHLNSRFRPDSPNLKAAFAVIDVLCDAHYILPGHDEWLEWAKREADFWTARQWSNGLFPLIPGGNADHLDANTDMIVSLRKLAERAGADRYRRIAARCAEGILSLHRRPGGYVLSVDPAGKTEDGRVFVKYQALLLKLALLGDSPGGIYANPMLLSLLRDR